MITHICIIGQTIYYMSIYFSFVNRVEPVTGQRGEIEDYPMVKNCRVGVVGCGFFAQNHLNAWTSLRCEGVEIAAVCDLSEAQAKQSAKAFSVPNVYTDMAEMIACEYLDLLDIVTQVGSHKRLVSIALEAGIPTIVQKPFGQTLAECEQMLSLSHRTGCFLAVHENFRFQHPHQEIRKILAAGTIGEPNWGRISFRTGYDIYAGQPYLRDEEQFIVSDIGVHLLDMARVFFGEVSHLTAELQRRDLDVKGEDTATLTLRHTSGAVSLVDCSYAARQLPDPFPVTTVEIEGTRGGLRLNSDLTLAVSSDGRQWMENVDPAVLSWAERPWHVVQQSVLAVCKHTLDRMKAGQPAEISAADNIKTFALSEAAYRAASTGGRAQPKY